MATKTTDNDKKFRELLARMKKASGDRPYVKIGYLAEKNVAKDEFDKTGNIVKDSKTTLVQVASWMEFGTEHIPERPFIRNTIDKYQNQYREFIKKFKMSVILGKESADHLLGILGEKIKGDITKTVVEGQFEPLSETSIKERIARSKGKIISYSPLIDTGQLKNSVSWKIFKGGKK